MTYAVYILGLFISALFGWASFLVTVNKLGPFSDAGMALGFFYGSLFIALSATFALVGYYLRLWINRNEIYFSHINTSLRQGMLLSGMVCISLVFQSMRVLTWWDALLLLLLALFIEFYFMGREI